MKLLPFLVLGLFLAGCATSPGTVDADDDFDDDGQRTTTESDIRNEIEAAKYCDTDEDCVSIYGQCPFGCYIAVNQNEADRIYQVVHDYPSNCAYACLPSGGARCVENQCEEIIPELNESNGTLFANGLGDDNGAY